jgi:hypothetical protein
VSKSQEDVETVCIIAARDNSSSKPYSIANLYRPVTVRQHYVLYVHAIVAIKRMSPVVLSMTVPNDT